MAFTSLSVVIVSTMTFILGTFPEFQSEEESGHAPEYPDAVTAMHIIDNITVAFFLMEYVVRIIVVSYGVNFMSQKSKVKLLLGSIS